MYTPLKVTAYIGLVLVLPEQLPCLLIQGFRGHLVRCVQSVILLDINVQVSRRDRGPPNIAGPARVGVTEKDGSSQGCSEIKVDCFLVSKVVPERWFGCAHV